LLSDQDWWQVTKQAVKFAFCRLITMWCPLNQSSCEKEFLDLNLSDKVEYHLTAYIFEHNKILKCQWALLTLSFLKIYHFLHLRILSKLKIFAQDGFYVFFEEFILNQLTDIVWIRIICTFMKNAQFYCTWNDKKGHRNKNHY